MSQIECVRYTPVNKGTLLGFAKIYVPKWGIEIDGITFHEKNGAKWVAMPSKPYEKDGEKKYAPYFRFREKEHYDLFCQRVKEAIEGHAGNPPKPPQQENLF